MCLLKEHQCQNQGSVTLVYEYCVQFDHDIERRLDLYFTKTLLNENIVADSYLKLIP